MRTLSLVMAFIILCSISLAEPGRHKCDSNFVVSGISPLAKETRMKLCGNIANLTAAEREIMDSIVVTEKRILDTLKKGVSVDLSQRECIGRIIRASFIERIATQAKDSGLHYHGIMIAGADIIGDLNLLNATVPYELNMNDCDFWDDVSFQDCIFKRDIRLEKSRFHGKAIFNKMETLCSFSLSNAILTGNVDAKYVKIGMNLIADSIFVVSKLADTAIYRDTLKSIITKWKESEHNLDALITYLKRDSSMYVSCSTSNCSFYGAKIGGGAQFGNAVIFSSLDFTHCRISNNLELVNTMVLGSEGLSINGSEVGRSIYLRNCQFIGTIDAQGARIGSNLRGDTLICSGDGNFTDIKVEYNVFLEYSRFDGSISLTNASMNRDLRMNQARILGDSTVLSGVAVGGTAYLDGLLFGGMLIMKNASFHNLSFNGLQHDRHGADLQKNDYVFDFDEMTYIQISADTTKDASMNILLGLLDSASFNIGMYTTLEGFYKREGEGERADAVYKKRMWRESKEKGGFLNWVRYYLYKWSIGFGRNPEYSFGFFLGLAFLGSWVFRKRNMNVGCEEEYRSFFYSLDLALPLIALGFRDKYNPRQGAMLQAYKVLHIILGWVFMIFSLAAFGGLFT
ncbi:MAG: hypothetical protein NT002_11610 [candidate division Zixibacteria bacterium]|nr:hypothetical protein [candidate division Zixibacteria bacterium]